MKKQKVTKYLFLLLMVFPWFVSAQSYDVKTQKGGVSFIYDGKTKGVFTDVDVTINIDPNDLSKGSIGGSVDVSTLNTDSKMRDKHLQAKKYFDSDNYPTLTFSSSEVTKDGDTFVVKGKLKIKRTEKEVTFYAIIENENLVFSTTIYGLDYDVAISKKREKTKIDIQVTVPLS